MASAFSTTHLLIVLGSCLLAVLVVMRGANDRS
jgi:hypothetical protein